MIKEDRIPISCVRIRRLLVAYGYNYVEETMKSHALSIEKPGDFLELEKNLIKEAEEKKETVSEKRILGIWKRKKKKKTKFPN